MKEWFIAGGIHLVIGFVIGWVVFKRPQWADDLAAFIKSTLHL